MNIPAVFKKSYGSWYKECINVDKEWELKVKKNPFIAIESHIHEDATTDLLAHILQTNSAIKEQFITFLLDKAEDNKTIESKEEITDEDVKKTEIETQYSTKNGRLDLFIKIPYKYHIIIESKIFDAKEQPDQMKRYIEVAEKEAEKEIKKGKVLAFYATSDGQGKCQTAGGKEYIPLAFYSPGEKTIYSVLSDFKDDTLTQDFCFYLRYRFLNPQSVFFLQELIKEYKIDLCSQDCFKKLFEGDYPSISKNISPYEDPKNYFMQLLKVHALNCYLLKEFKKEKDNYSYHAVFDGIRVKRQAKIGNTDCNVYFETKYDKNYFFMVITICSLNEIYEKKMKLLKDYLYKEQNELNEEFTYSHWLWILDPIEIKRNKEKRNYLNLNQCNNYEDYIKFIFTNCMKEIFDAITEKKEIDKEALEHYKNLS